MEKLTLENTDIITFFTPQYKRVALVTLSSRTVLMEWIDQNLIDAVSKGFLSTRYYHRSALKTYLRAQQERQLTLF